MNKPRKAVAAAKRRFVFTDTAIARPFAAQNVPALNEAISFWDASNRHAVYICYNATAELLIAGSNLL
jgi:hypothetical protein